MTTLNPASVVFEDASSNPIVVSAANPLPTAVGTATSGGLSISYATLANSNNATSVKASAGQVYFVRAFNNSTTIAYLKFYNKASAPTPASDTVVDKFMIPASSGVIHSITAGIPFSTGIAYAVVTGIGDTDNTSVAASAYSVTVGYK